MVDRDKSKKTNSKLCDFPTSSPSEPAQTKLFSRGFKAIALVRCSAMQRGEELGDNNTSKRSAANRLEEERRGGENIVILNQITEEWMQATGSIIVRWGHQFNG